MFFSLGNTATALGKSYPLCPYCYNNQPSFTNDSTAEIISDQMGCNSCQHPTCRNGLNYLGVCQCPGGKEDGQQCTGRLVLGLNL